MINKTSLLFILFLSITPIFAQHLKIYTEEWKPISFSEDGEIKGLAVDIVNEILKRLGSDDEIVIVPWARGWEMISDYPDVVLFTMTLTPNRVKQFKLIGPVAVGKTNFYAKSDSNFTINKLKDAKQVKSIGVYRSAVEEQYLTDHGFENLDPTSLPVFSAKKLVNGRISLWCNADLTAADILDEAGYPFSAIKNVYTIRDNYLYIAFSKETNDEIVEQWFSALKAIKSEGMFEALYLKWLPELKPPMETRRIGVKDRWYK